MCTKPKSCELRFQRGPGYCPSCLWARGWGPSGLCLCFAAKALGSADGQEIPSQGHDSDPSTDVAENLKKPSQFPFS